MLNRVYIISGSPEFDLEFVDLLKDEFKNAQAVIAVDKGAEICSLLDITVTYVIGDFDSIDPKILEKFPEEKKLKYDIDKDLSDTELAVDIALEQYGNGDIDIIIINGEGARWDHFLFNVSLLLKAPCRIRMLSKYQTLWALESNKMYNIPLDPGTTFSIIPLSRCTGVSIQNAKYPLNNQIIDYPSTLTLSNIAENNLRISFKTGNLLFYTEAPII